jgi:hypothetical protein
LREADAARAPRRAGKAEDPAGGSCRCSKSRHSRSNIERGRHQPFIHTLLPKRKSHGNRPAGFNQEEEMIHIHLNFLALMVVIVIIKVKIIIKKR